jgi:predicted nucleic-acid-binding protein
VKVAVDTNVLVRYLTWDDERQAEAAAAAIEGAEVLILSTVVLCELVWVLRRAYRYPAGDVLNILRQLLETRSVELDRPAAEAGCAMLAAGGDFADGVILHQARQGRATRLVTFDADFAGRGPAKLVQLLQS